MEGIFSMEKWRSIAAGMSCLSMLFATGAVTVSASDEITEIPEQSIVYWSMWEEDEPQADVIREAAEAYEEATGISVEIQWKGRGIRSLIEPALDAGEQIDLFDEAYYAGTVGAGEELGKWRTACNAVSALYHRRLV